MDLKIDFESLLDQVEKATENFSIMTARHPSRDLHPTPTLNHWDADLFEITKGLKVKQD